MFINYRDIKDKILGCWLGKNIGGTLGAPFEWRRQLNQVEYYTHDVDGNPLPNDDLDIQLLWLIAMEQQGIDLSSEMLAHYWEVFITPHWAEYGIAKANMKLGLVPPLSGDVNNIYKHSCGSYIRSEIWACIAPGTPEIAVKYAMKDSQIDHGGKSEGTYASVFITALESAAFLVKDIRKLIEIGLSYIPEDCGVAEAVRLVLEQYDKGSTYVEVRDRILQTNPSMPYTYFDERGEMVKLVSQRDVELGLDHGQKGYDVVSNIAIVIIGLIYGENDFEKSLLTAVNCGEDTDCTAATIGSVFGILLGASGLPEKWTKPIGDAIVTCCLNKGEIEHCIPRNLYELTERTIRLFQKTSMFLPLNVCFTQEGETDMEEIPLLCGKYAYQDLYRFSDCVYKSFSFFDVAVEYKNSCMIQNEEEGKDITVYLINKFCTCENVALEWLMEDNITVNRKKGLVFLPQDKYGDHVQAVPFHFTFQGDDLSYEPVLKISMEGRAVSECLGIRFLKGAL